MKRFKIEITDQALSDIESSFKWGIENWGTERANEWYLGLYTSINEKLSKFAAAMPIAPESDELGIEVRHLIHNRYRVIFELSGKMVRILHVTGAFVNREKDIW